MRILFVAAGAYGHLYPVIPLALAAQRDGALSGRRGGTRVVVPAELRLATGVFATLFAVSDI